MDIAIIDSGINSWHSHVQKVEGGVSFHVGPTGAMIEDGDYTDNLGHGTALAGIIRELVPEAKLYAVKIFHETLNCSMNALLAGLNWSIQNNMKLIHLSLGTTLTEYKQVLHQRCKEAVDKNIIIVAAARAADDLIFPAAFEEVIGVYWNRACERGTIVYHPESKIELGTYGRPRDLPGMPRGLNFSGHSFAAAHITALAANFLENNSQAGPYRIKKMIINQSKEE